MHKTSKVEGIETVDVIFYVIALCAHLVSAFVDPCKRCSTYTVSNCDLQSEWCAFLIFEKMHGKSYENAYYTKHRGNFSLWIKINFQSYFRNINLIYHLQVILRIANVINCKDIKSWTIPSVLRFSCSCEWRRLLLWKYMYTLLAFPKQGHEFSSTSVCQASVVFLACLLEGVAFTAEINPHRKWWHDEYYLKGKAPFWIFLKNDFKDITVMNSNT